MDYTLSLVMFKLSYLWDDQLLEVDRQWQYQEPLHISGIPKNDPLSVRGQFGFHRLSPGHDDHALFCKHVQNNFCVVCKLR